MHTVSAQRQGLPHPSPRQHQRAVADRQAGKQTKPNSSNAPKARLYNPRHPEQTLLYGTVAEHFDWVHSVDRTDSKRGDCLERHGDDRSMSQCKT